MELEEITALRLLITNILPKLATGGNDEAGGVQGDHGGDHQAEVSPEPGAAERVAKTRRQGLNHPWPNTLRSSVRQGASPAVAARKRRAALTDASAAGGALVMRRMSSSHVSRNT